MIDTSASGNSSRMRFRDSNSSAVQDAASALSQSKSHASSSHSEEERRPRGASDDPRHPAVKGCGATERRARNGGVPGPSGFFRPPRPGSRYARWRSFSLNRTRLLHFGEWPCGKCSPNRVLRKLHLQTESLQRQCVGHLSHHVQRNGSISIPGSFSQKQFGGPLTQPRWSFSAPQHLQRQMGVAMRLVLRVVVSIA